MRSLLAPARGVLRHLLATGGPALEVTVTRLAVSRGGSCRVSHGRRNVEQGWSKSLQHACSMSSKPHMLPWSASLCQPHHPLELAGSTGMCSACLLSHRCSVPVHWCGLASWGKGLAGLGGGCCAMWLPC